MKTYVTKSNTSKVRTPVARCNPQEELTHLGPSGPLLVTGEVEVQGGPARGTTYFIFLHPIAISI